MSRPTVEGYFDSLISGAATPGDYDKHTAEEILNDITTEGVVEEADAPTWTRAEAESIARSLASGQSRIEDYDPRVAKWKSEETIRDAIRHGDMGVKQFVKELHRRQGVGLIGVEVPDYVDDDPVNRATPEQKG